MPGILIVYFSRGGNTRRVAEHLAADLGADLEEIVDKTSHPVCSAISGADSRPSSGALRRLRRPHMIRERELAISATPIAIARFAVQIRAVLAHASSPHPAARATAGAR